MSEFFKCPQCKETGQTANKERKCFKCGWREANAYYPVRKLTYGEEKREREEKVRVMTSQLISDAPPNLLFTEEELKNAGFSLEDDKNCWGWAYSPTNSLRISNYYPSFDTYALHRRQFTNSVAHETAHLSPNRKLTLDDENIIYHVDNGKDIYILNEELLTDEEVEQIKGGFPNNCVPNKLRKNSWIGEMTYTDARGYQLNWGAGKGHGWGWYGEFQNYKGQLYSSHQSWIDDPRQFNRWTEGHFKYPTFSNGWFRERKWNKDQVIASKSRQYIDLYGDDFMNDEDEDLYKWTTYFKK